MYVYLNRESKNTLELVFGTRPEMEKFKDWVEEAVGVNTYNHNNSSDNISITSELTISTQKTFNTNTTTPPTDTSYLGAQVDQVKKLVDAYVILLKKKFK
jgi:hypothetical protein